MSHCCWSTAKLGSSGKSSEAKVTVADLLYRTLHSFWPCFHSCPPFPHTVDAQHYSLFCSFSVVILVLLLTHSHSLVPRISTLSSHQSLLILVNLLSSPTTSWSIRLAAPSLLRCPILAACTSSALSPPRCLILVALPLLSHPRCLTLPATSSLQLLISAPLTLLTLINPPFAGAPISSNFGRSFLRCHPFSCLHHVFRAVFLLSRYT